MCGRYAITLPPEAMRQLFGYCEQPNFPPRFNVAPTQPVPVVRLERDPDNVFRRHFALVRWGFLPGFVKDVRSFPLIINARSETLAEKPSFRNAVRRRRCLFVMDGYYEWQRHGGKTRSLPYLIRRSDAAPMAVAGLWEHLMTPDGSEIETACLITVPASAALGHIHDRMPAVLQPDEMEQWLEPDERYYQDALRLLRPQEDGAMSFVAIGDAVNKVGNDGPGVQVPIGLPV